MFTRLPLADSIITYMTEQKEVLVSSSAEHPIGPGASHDAGDGGKMADT